MITTTLNRIKAHSPCKDGWEKLLKFLGKTKADNEPLPFLTILISNGLDDVLWCCQAEPELDNIWRTFICRVIRETPLADGRKVWDLLADPRSQEAVVTAELFVKGGKTQKELDAAWDAARDAAGDAARAAARDAAWDAAWDAIKNIFTEIIK